MRRILSWLRRLLFDRNAVVLPAFCYLMLLVAATLFSARNPKYGWDMLAYIGVIESWHTPDAAEIQQSAYSAIRNLPENGELTGSNASAAVDTAGTASYRSDAAHNPAHFVQQLRFYSIKPLYVSAVAVLHAFGWDYPKSFVRLSATGYFATGMAVWIWLVRYWPAWLTTGFAALLIMNPELVSIARSTTPDAFALMFVAWGVYLLLEFPRLIWGPLLLLLSIWVRPDELILVGLLLLMSFWLRVSSSAAAGPQIISTPSLLRTRLASNWQWIFLIALLLGTYRLQQFVVRPYSWSTLFYHSFIKFLSTPADAVVKVTPRMYLHVFAASVRTLLGNTDIALIFLLGILALLLHVSPIYRLATAVILTSGLIHFLLYPSDSPRFHAPAELFIPVSLLIACAHRLYPKRHLRQPSVVA